MKVKKAARQQGNHQVIHAFGWGGAADGGWTDGFLAVSSLAPTGTISFSQTFSVTSNQNITQNNSLYIKTNLTFINSLSVNNEQYQLALIDAVPM